MLKYSQTQGPRLVVPTDAIDRTPKKHLQQAFTSSLTLPAETEPQLLGAVCHLLNPPGSIVRAELSYQMARAYEIEEEHAQELAIAVEYFHRASLVLEDLPCMENAADRGGALCVHQVYGESAAILAALSLINRAYALLWRALADIPKARQLIALAFVEKCLGVEGLLNRQSHDLHSTGVSGDPSSGEEVALSKTVPLMRLSLVLPALAGGAPAAELNMLERVAFFWGLSYQILDDIKAIQQRKDRTNKTNARNAKLYRPNLAFALGVNSALLRIERLLRLADRFLDRLTQRLPALSFAYEFRFRLCEEIAVVKAAGYS